MKCANCGKDLPDDHWCKYCTPCIEEAERGKKLLDKPDSLLAKFLDEPEVWVDRFCENCGRAFRTKLFMKKYYCTECYLGIFQ